MRGMILVIEGDAAVSDLVATGLRRAGFEVTTAADPAEVPPLLEQIEVDVIVIDPPLGGATGPDVCARLGESRPDVPVILVTGSGSPDTASGAIRAGAYDVLSKPLEPDALVVAIERALQHRRLRTEVQRLRRMVEDARGPGVHALAPLAEVEYRHIVRVLEAMHGNKTLAARALGIDRKTLHRKLVARSDSNGGASGRGDRPQPD